MPEHDPQVLSFSHLAQMPREKEALQTLKKIASVVKPIMRARGWVVRELAEFFPDQDNLLGLNVNRGHKILLRLRYAGDKTQFLPIEQATDTMLHELSHIVHGPHDAKFHALWDQLRDEHEGLVMKGYTGEGFLSDGRRLGGNQIPMHEARRLARQAAEKRQALTSGSGKRLGGAAPRPGQDIRQVIADAAERRTKTLQGCGNTNHNDAEIQIISESATRNGFRTQAEEDAANEAAIAQALWELVQEDEKAKYGSSYIPPSAANPAGNGGWSVLSAADQAAGMQNGNGKHSLRDVGGPAPPVPDWSRPTDGSRAPPVPEDSRPKAPRARSPPPPEQTWDWTCDICTLRNPANYLCCDACGTERPERTTQKLARKDGAPSKRPRTEVVDLTEDASSKPSASTGMSIHSSTHMTATPPAAAVPATWQCSFCGTVMERQWWTCSLCGKMKDSSR